MRTIELNFLFFIIRKLKQSIHIIRKLLLWMLMLAIIEEESQLLLGDLICATGDTILHSILYLGPYKLCIKMTFTTLPTRYFCDFYICHCRFAVAKQLKICTFFSSFLSLCDFNTTLRNNVLVVSLRYIGFIVLATFHQKRTTSTSQLNSGFLVLKLFLCKHLCCYGTGECCWLSKRTVA